jgi:hypothetical protein
MKPKDVLITKASGETDHYDGEKLRDSLRKSGATEEAVDRVVEEIESQLRFGMSTRKIYRKAFQALRRNSIHAASRYQLKQAIMELGPSGYPFERFIAGLFAAKGYRTEVGRVVDGLCVKHELDVIAWQNGHVALAECKFRNQPGSKTDVKVALYFHARVNDVVAAWNRDKGHSWRNSGLGETFREVAGQGLRAGWQPGNLEKGKDANQEVAGLDNPASGNTEGTPDYAPEHGQRRDVQHSIHQADEHPDSSRSRVSDQSFHTLDSYLGGSVLLPPSARRNALMDSYGRSPGSPLIRKTDPVIVNGGPRFEGWLVTNAKFTDDAIMYGSCAGLRLLGWDYPENASLVKLIEQTRLMPVTMLQSLSKRDKGLLLDQDITMCQDLFANATIMEKLGIDKSRRRRAMNELDAILDVP